MLTPFPRPKIKEIPNLGKRHHMFISFLTDKEGSSELLSAYRYYKVKYKSCPFSLKYGITSNQKFTIKEMIREINNLLFIERNILIHCAAGIDRTGFMTLLICLTGGYSLKESLQIIEEKRPKILERIDKHIPLAKEFYNEIGDLQKIVGKI